jgi:hypothetical protein
VITLSSAEHRQLDAVYGEDWATNALGGCGLKFLVRHSSRDALVSRARGADMYLESVEELIAAAREQATRYASQALTGLGARFDGVLTAAMLRRWAEE